LLFIQNKHNHNAQLVVASDSDGFTEKVGRLSVPGEGNWINSLIYQERRYSPIPSGTRVAILDRGFWWDSPSKIRVIGGEFQGKMGIVADEDLRSVDPGKVSDPLVWIVVGLLFFGLRMLPARQTGKSVGSGSIELASESVTCIRVVAVVWFCYCRRLFDQ
jgi:hypothetical protein